MINVTTNIEDFVYRYYRYCCSFPERTTNLIIPQSSLSSSILLPYPQSLPSSFLPSFLQGTEWTCTKRRMLAGIITDYAFGLGYMLLAGIAYLIRDWRNLQLAISVPGFLLIFYIW